ncbi:MAG: hypothetical protein IK083_06210 [Abditibacteriota bacterium]|nr:hypothetical protein [Abditibacteriota bacterium]
MIKELGKPAGDRRFVLIRDIPENAEKWIAAIGYAFSPEIAAEITFATNKTLADRSAKELLFLDDGSPLYMLTGCHPSDESWSYAQDRIKNRYALLDGEAKAFSAPDADIPKSAYYEDISGNSEEFRHFTETWLPAMGIKAVDAALIPGIYGCYKNLLDRSEYPTLKDSVKYLTEFLGSETAAADEIANIMFEKGIYASVAGKDKTNGFELLQLLLLKCQARESLITEQIADMVKGFLADNAAKYLQYMNAMNSRISWFPDKIAPLVFDSAVLWQYYPAVEKAGAGSALALLKRFDDWNKGNPEQMPEAKEFIYRCVKAVFSQDSEKEKADIITMFTNRDVLKAGVCERITADMDKTPGTLELAFRLPHNKPSDFCTLLGNCDIDLAESYLANRIGKETLEEKLFQYFVECKNCFGSGESTGTMFLTRWMESHNNYSEMIDLINGLSDTAKEKLFADLDKKLLGDQSDNSEELFIKLPQGSKCREIYDFKTEFCSGQLMKNSETGIYECVAQVPPLGLTADEIFINSKLFGNIIKKACKMKDPQMHLTLLKKFDIKAEALYSYIRVCLANDKNDPHIRETLVRTAGLAEGELKEDIQRQLEKCDAEDKPTSGVSNKRQDSQPSTGSQNGTLGNKIQSKGGSNFNPLLLSGFFIMAILVLFVVVVFLISQYFDVSWTIDIPPLLRWPCN